MPPIFLQGRQGYGRSYGNRTYLFTTYPNIRYKDYHNIMEDKATKIQSLFIHNKFKKKQKDRKNAKTLEANYNLPPNSLLRYFQY